MKSQNILGFLPSADFAKQNQRNKEVIFLKKFMS